MTDQEKLLIAYKALVTAQDALSIVVDADPDMVEDSDLEEIALAIQLLAPQKAA